MRTFHFFGVRSREAARWSWQRSLEPWANAHRKERTTKEYLRADRLALRRSPRARFRPLHPRPATPTISELGTSPSRWPRLETRLEIGAVGLPSSYEQPPARVSYRTGHFFVR